MHGVNIYNIYTHARAYTITKSKKAKNHLLRATIFIVLINLSMNKIDNHTIHILQVYKTKKIDQLVFFISMNNAIAYNRIYKIV